MTQQTFRTDDVRLTIVYDNYAFRPELETAWGFSCVIEGFEQTILFDTGGDAAIFRRNMAALQIDPRSIDILILSHAHWDHQNGIPALLEKHSDVTAYLLQAFPAKLHAQAAGYGADVVEVRQSLEICNDVYSTGKLGTKIPEQALILNTARGLIIVTGCAHPGIVAVVEKAKELCDNDVLLVIGGFHLHKAKPQAAHDIVRDFRALGVQNIAPTHCSGDSARRVFADAYRANCLPVGAGKVLTLEDL